MKDDGRADRSDATENEEGGGVIKNQNHNHQFILFATYITDFLYNWSNSQNLPLKVSMSE